MQFDLPLDRLGNPSVKPTTLIAIGNYDVAPEVLAWVHEVSSAIRRRLGARTPLMHLRAYRCYGGEHLSCDFTDEAGELAYLMTFIVDEGLWLSPTEPRTPDLAEALFLAGLLAKRVKATTIIETAVG
jgi:hypothetical protein